MSSSPYDGTYDVEVVLDNQQSYEGVLTVKSKGAMIYGAYSVESSLSTLVFSNYKLQLSGSIYVAGLASISGKDVSEGAKFKPSFPGVMNFEFKDNTVRICNNTTFKDAQSYTMQLAGELDTAKAASTTVEQPA